MRAKKSFLSLVVTLLAFSFFNLANAQKVIKESALRQMQSLQDEKASRTPAQKKLDSQLWYALKMSRNQRITDEVATMEIDLDKDAGGRVAVDIYAAPTDVLRLAITGSGGEIIFSSAQYNRISARISLQALEQIASLQEVRFIYPLVPPSHAGELFNGFNTNKKQDTPGPAVEAIPFSRVAEKEVKKFHFGFEQRAERVRQQVIKALTGMGYTPETTPIGSQTSNGDVKHKADQARTTFSVNGAGIKIGVLSDSYNNGGGAAADVASGDLPGPGNPNGFTTAVTVLSDLGSGGTDEGRAMLQIIHDLAPGAQLYFATAFISEASFAANINALQAAGCDIICDDVFYYDEPPFQDGIVAQAVNNVTSLGSIYFSSAGNQGNLNDNTSGVWEGDFNSTGGNTVGSVTIPGGTIHNFAGAVGAANPLQLSSNRLFLFWSDPWGASGNDYDLYVLDAGLTVVVASSTNVQSGTQDPLEFITTTQAAGRQLVVFRKTGAATRALHLNTFRRSALAGPLAEGTNGQTHGHSSAVNAYSVAATEALGAGAFTSANNVEIFSSDGLRRMFLTPAGAPISGGVTFASGGGITLQKPDITAADGVATSVPGFNPFYGTSAAAPHAAAITALLKQYAPGLTPAQIRTALVSTAVDNEAAGVDRDAGNGIVMALEALTSVVSCTITCPANITVSNAPNQCGAVVNYAAPTTSGTCGTVTTTPASGSFFPVGTTTVNATSSVGGGSCSFTVTVNDTQPPSITCPANIELCGSQSVFYSTIVTDNCPGVTVNYLPASGSVFPVGTTTVTATATDGSGNTASCSFTVKINPIPTVNPVSNQTVCNNAPTAAVNFSGAVSGTLFNWTNSNPSIGLPASGTGNIPSFIATNPGPGPVTATITVTPSTNSNSFSQTFNYTGAVQSWVVPAGVTSINIQAFGAQGNRSAFNVAGGLGGLASGTLAVAPGNTLYIMVGGGNTITTNGGFNGGGNAGLNAGCVTANGGGGGGASDVRLNVNALANRVLVAAGGGGAGGNRVAGCGRGTGGGGGGGLYGGGGGAGWPGVPPGGPVPTGGTQAAGGAGGITTFSPGPTNGFPGTLGIGGVGGTEVASAQGGSATAQPGGVGGGLTGGNGLYNSANNWTGQSGAGGSSYIGGVTGGITSSGVRSGNGEITISYVLPGVPVICTGSPTSFTITVNPPPTVSCPANITVNATPGQCGAIVNYPPATGTGIPAPTITYSIASGSFFPVGTTTITATATNTCGVATCTFTITVLDNVAPTVTCPANITVNNDPNLCSAVVSYGYPSFADNCQRFQVPATILAHGGGAITVAGNTLPGGFYFDLRNNTATPKLIGSFQVRFGSAAFGAVPSPTPVNVYVTTSASTYVGNQTNAAAWTTVGTGISVTVAGPNSEFSTVTLPGGGFILPANTQRGIYIFGTSASLVYNSAANSSAAPITNSTGTLTLTPGEARGALFGGTALTPRTPNVVINYISLALTGGLASGSAFPVGLTTNTYTVTDDGGNSANCSFTVRVNDTQAPTITCPANITVTTPIGSCTANVNYSGTASDNCPGATVQLVSGPASGSAFPIGVTTVTLRAVDAAGNTSANCSFTVTVLDGQLPVISTQPANRTVCVGTSATFSVVSSNVVSYQWQAWNGSAWVDIAGATASSYTINNVTHSMNTNSFRVRIAGLCTTILSNHATLYVNPLPSVSIVTSIPPTLLPTQTVTLTAVVSPGGGTYQWFKNNAAISGATSSTLGPLGVLDVGAYKVTYVDPNGCINTSADVEVKPQSSTGIYIYPNPNAGQFHIRFFNTTAQSITVLVYDYLGQKIFTQVYPVPLPTYSVVDVDLGKRLAIGSYLVMVLNEKKQRIGVKWISVGRE